VGKLTASWIERLGTDGYADLATELHRFPELRDAVVPSGFQFTVEPNESQMETCDDVVAFELIVHLLAPLAGNVERWRRTGHVDIGVDPDQRVLLIHTLDTPPVLHRGRIGARIVNNLVDLGHSLELDEVWVEANKIGRWAWARWGFEFADDAERERVLRAAKCFADTLGRSVDVSSIERPGDFAALIEPVSAEAVRAAGGPVIDGGREVSLGKALLLGPAQQDNYWRGRLKL